VAGKRGLVGSTAAWQPVSAESPYPATYICSPSRTRGHKIRAISAQIEFLGGTANGLPETGKPKDQAMVWLRRKLCSLDGGTVVISAKLEVIWAMSG
jgi:hypothetical protein